MATHTVTAMYKSRNDAERAASAIREDVTLGATSVKVLPEHGEGVAADTTGTRPAEGGFMNSLRNFFMPEEDRYGYAEGMRRGSYMVAVDTDDAHADQIMTVLEEAGAIDLDEEENRWRSEGWRGYETSTAATAGSYATTGTIEVPPSTTGVTGTGATATAVHADTGTTASSVGTQAAGTTETIPIAEETLRVGKRQVNTGRVRVRSYVVETPINETVHLREEHVEVERRTVDRPVTAGEDPFREREIEATTSREEAVVSKEARIKEELVLHKSTEDHEETVHDTVRRTEVREDQGDNDAVDANGTVRNPGTRPV